MVGGGAHRVGVPLLRAGGAGGGGPVAAVAAGDGAAAQQQRPPAPAAAPGGEAGSEGLAAAAEHAGGGYGAALVRATTSHNLHDVVEAGRELPVVRARRGGGAWGANINHDINYFLR